VGVSCPRTQRRTIESPLCADWDRMAVRSSAKNFLFTRLGLLQSAFLQNQISLIVESENPKKQTLVKSNSFNGVNKFMIRAFKMLTVTLALLFFMTGCQAMTGATLGENIDDGNLTSYVKTKLASDKLVSLTRVGVETNNGVVYLTGEVETAEQKSRSGSLAFEVKGVKQVVNNLQVRKN